MRGVHARSRTHARARAAARLAVRILVRAIVRAARAWEVRNRPLSRRSPRPLHCRSMNWNAFLRWRAPTLRVLHLLVLTLAWAASAPPPAAALEPGRQADAAAAVSGASIAAPDAYGATAALPEAARARCRPCADGPTRTDIQLRAPIRWRASSLHTLAPARCRARTADAGAGIHAHRLLLLRSGGSLIATTTPPPVL